MKYQISQNRVFVPSIISNTGIFPTISDWDRGPIPSLNGRRFAFARDIRAYISGESIPQDEEEVSDFRRQGEYLMVRLRTSDGADMHDLENRYHVSTAPYEQVFRMLEKHGLAAHEGTRWYLTEQGFLVSNSIINAVVEAGE